MNKVVLDDFTFELNFTKKTRIDMCQTCHLAADIPGYDDPKLAEPYRSHPRLDLFLSAKSPTLSPSGLHYLSQGLGRGAGLHTRRSPTERDRPCELA